MNTPTILKPGKNCWRIEQADCVSFLVDGEDYFRAFREAAKKAQRSIMVVGWDFYSRLKLVREDPGDGYPTRLVEFLDYLVRNNPHLDIHVLNWDFSVIYATDREWLPVYKLDWKTHQRLHFHLDDQHPVGASHHQKIAVMDDRVAFVGGLDFTFDRWDTSAHRPDDSRRADTGGYIPQPYHDIEFMVSGDVAKSLGDLCRERWHTATQQTLDIPIIPDGNVPWPDSVKVDARHVNMGIARTYPAYKQQQPILEVKQLLVDAITSAKQTIYIENQFLTAPIIADALAQCLHKENGPEIVIVLPLQTDGWLPQHTMDVLRARVLNELMAVDHYDRLRVYYPHVPKLGTQCVNVHAKLLIVDDELVCAGSANFNNRSMSLDSECNLAMEARGDTHIGQAIQAFRNRLLAEHLDVTPDRVAAAMVQHGSLLETISTLSSPGRTLKPLPYDISDELNASVPDTPLADPECPMDSDFLARHLVPDHDRQPTRRTLQSLAAILVIILVLAASWRWTPLGEWLDINAILDHLAALRGEWFAPLVVSLIYILGGLIAFPVTLMIIATGIAFGAWYGFAYGILGAEFSAVVTYGIGHLLGNKTLQRLPHHWISRISRRLAQQGLLAIITLRVVPVAPFTVINLVAGASHIRFQDYALGSLLGMLPGTLALILFSDQVANAIQAPAMTRLVTILVLAIVIGTGIWGLSRWLLKRQHVRSK